MSFVAFRDAISKKFDAMGKNNLFCANVEKDSLWDTYLNSFPEGSNPLFRKRTEHDCSCCRGFIKNIGNVVSVSEKGEITTVWDVQIDNPAYQAVADAMSALIKANPIKSTFLYPEVKAGVRENHEDDEDSVRTWSHFQVEIPNRRNSGKNFFAKKDDILTLKGAAHANYTVFLGSLRTITVDACETILELIDQNSLYRGEENKNTVKQFLKLKKEFDQLPEENQDNFAWMHANSIPVPVATIKNRAIGTILNDLSEDMDLEAAVRRYEVSVAAPQNYKRSTALVSKKQVEQAKAKVEELGFTSALSRRYAKLSDINVNYVLFADRTLGKDMKGVDAFDDIATKPAKHKLDKIEEISIEKFLSDVLPKATSVEVLFDNKHINNLMSLITASDPTAKKLFKWDNPFSWTYNGDVTDSIKERVKKAGGNVTGELCCRLAWHNTDDLDFHMKESHGNVIYFGKKISGFSRGQLDVDMNVGGETREPVENIFYSHIQYMTNGVYTLMVNQFRKREDKDVGFEIEIDHLGSIIHMVYEKTVRQNEYVNVAEITKTPAGLTIKPLLPSSQGSKEVWGLKTMEFHRVNSIMLSPNHWTKQEGEEQSIGHKHYFFMLDKCMNEDQARGFYNEFLHNDLQPYRKVLEMVGSKIKTEKSADQLSGLGFSSTKRSEVIVKVTGAITRQLKVVF